MAQSRNLALSLCVVTACAVTACRYTGLGTGGILFSLMGHIVAQCRDLFCIAVGATGTGISLFTLFGTGGISGHLICMVMAQSRDLLIGRIVTAGASNICIPANDLTCSSLTGVILLIVTQCFHQHCLTYCTALWGFASRSRAFCMASCSSLIVGVGIATGSAGIGSITVLSTGGRGRHRFIIVTGRSYLILCVGVATGGAGISSIAVLGTGRCCHHRFIIVTIGLDHALRDQCHSADRALFAFCQTCIRTGRCLAWQYLLRMTGGGNLTVRVGVTTQRTGMGGIALFCTGGSSHHRLVAMPNCRNLRISSVITYRTVLISIPADGFTSGRFCIHLRQGVTSGGNFF